MILLIVDMQKGIVNDELFAFDTLMERTAGLVDAARKNNVEVIFFQHDDGPGSGFSIGDEDFEITERLKPLPEEKVFVKTIGSCFGNSDFKEYMEKQKNRRLMIIGLQTNYCIDCTVKSAFERGYEVIVPEGCNSTFDNEYMSAETTVRYYNEDIWEGVAESVSFEEALEMIRNNK